MNFILRELGRSINDSYAQARAHRDALQQPDNDNWEYSSDAMTVSFGELAVRARLAAQSAEEELACWPSGRYPE
jgi:hypothetical protein